MEQPSFEEELNQLEACVRKLESGEASLEDALRLYEEGMALAKRCQAHIEAAEDRVAQLVRGQQGIEAHPVTDVGDS
ncbi:MAG: exodeoxyribonuclease VII small subunit [Myxococcota bacterium]